MDRRFFQKFCTRYPVGLLFLASCFCLFIPHACAQNLLGNSSMASFVWQDGPHIVYLDLSNQVHQSWHDSVTNAWADQNITTTVAGPPALSGSPLTAFVLADGTHVVYVTNSQHLQQAWYNSTDHNWYDMDITADVKGPLVSSTTGLTSFLLSSDGPHIAYTSNDQHLQQAWYNMATGHWTNMDITADVAGPQLSLTTALTSFQLSGDGPHVFYTDTNQHLQQVWYNIAQAKWYSGDITAGTQGPLLMKSTGLSSFVLSANGPHVLYVANNQHLVQAWYNPNTGVWSNDDITGDVTGPLVSASSGLSTILLSDGPHAMYVASNQHLMQAWYNQTTGAWTGQDLNASVASQLASASSDILAFQLSDGLHVTFTDVDGHIYQLWYTSSGSWVSQDITIAAKAAGGAYALSATEYVYLGSKLVAVEHW